MRFTKSSGSLIKKRNFDKSLLLVIKQPHNQEGSFQSLHNRTCDIYIFFSGTRRITGCSGSAWQTASTTGEKGRSSSGSSRSALLRRTDRNSRGSSSSLTGPSATRPTTGTASRAPSKSPWAAKASRGYGRSTRSTSHSTATSTTTRGLVPFIRYIKNFPRKFIPLLFSNILVRAFEVH